MKARPIIFNAPMVRALLDGSKTQTRRAVKSKFEIDYLPLDLDGPIWPHNSTYSDAFEEQPMLCPYGQPGDRLWVRETWRTDASLDDKAPRTFNGWPVQYDADGKTLRHGAFYGDTKGKTRPSLFMPRWASRILLEIVSVRVERLQGISEADAMAEGCKNSLHMPGGRFANENYAHLWWTINGDGSWEANLWVWVIEFKKAAS